ncbi:MAG: alcohol dehydrogenase catalytic domain-containing protein, partial [Acidobacteria bacterium]|nr:alcohol dehydrogenase catalytic domain-containing protein [Acidobacteriota bacterium]
MKALRFDGSALSIGEIPRPHAPEEALVRVTLSGICNTDLEIAKGYAGFTGTIGHEFVGVVEETRLRPELIGRRVVGEINAGCGMCSKCALGDSRHCAARTVLGIVGRDGSHAEYLSLPARNLIPVPPELTDEKAVFTEPLAAALGIAEQVDITKDTRLAVVGDGKLGLLCAMGARLRSENVTLIGRHPEKMQLAAPSGIGTVLSNRTE